jgi:hypothetical protein
VPPPFFPTQARQNKDQGDERANSDENVDSPEGLAGIQSGTGDNNVS